MSLRSEIESAWGSHALEELKRFIAIPAKNQAFDPSWKENGYLMQALKNAQQYGLSYFPDATFEIIEIEGATPALFIDIPAKGGHDGKPAFFYGHFDKQPEMDGWSNGLGAFTPVIRDGRLYGRGSCDDGYSFYSALSSVLALRRTNTPHPRITGLFETDEETGSAFYDQYLDMVKEKIGEPSVLFILDLSSPSTDRLWLTQSLRGVIAFTIKVKALTTPVHSGAYGNLVPNPLSVLRAIFDAFEDPRTGIVNRREILSRPIPERHEKSIKQYAELIGDGLIKSLPLLDGVHPMYEDPVKAVQEAAWAPSFTVLGLNGIPEIGKGGALIHKEASASVAFRIPPGIDAKSAFEFIRSEMIDPYISQWNVKIDVSDVRCEDGFDVPELPLWLDEAWSSASMRIFGNPPASLFEGASIGTMKLFGRAFPNSPFIGTGVLGPHSNAHAADESLDLEYTTRLSEAVAMVIEAIPRSRN